MHRIVIIAFLTLFTGLLVFAGTSGKIAGYVKDAANGEPIIGATILIEGTRLGAAADVNGYYVILNVPPGKFNVSASAVGYPKMTFNNVSVQVDLTSKVDFNLQNEAVSVQEVVVTAQRPVVRKDLTSVEARVDAEQIKNLPTTEVRDVLTLQTGITVDRGGGIHIRGGRSTEVAYWVDGRPITDAYDNSQSVQLSNTSLQELQVVSGTFNAEYGNAMSGIINIVTKDGGTNYSGSLNLYSGGYVTANDDIFYNLGKLRPFSTANIEGTLSGPVPIIGERMRFFATGRYYKTDGYLYGIRRFTPQGAFTDANRADSGKAVPMNNSTQYTGQAKLSYYLSPLFKLTFGAIGSKRDYRDYNHAFRLNPDGDINKHDRGLDLSAQLTHTLSSAAFYTINASRSYREYFDYLYENPLDPRYVSPESLLTQPYEFFHAGTSNGHFRRNTTTWDLKFDMTDQLDPVHQVKFGVEGKMYRLYLDGFGIVGALDSLNQPITPWRPSVLGDTATSHSRYLRKPYEFSGYIQDKIEYQSVIINVGLRFDYFAPQGDILADPSDPNIYNPFNLLNIYHDLNSDGIIDNTEKTDANKTTIEERRAYWYKAASKKYQVSPRFGIAYPITDQGVIHFSYGHFLQIPSFNSLYDNPDYKVSNSSSGLQGVFGNPDLKPQKTVMYELGLQQQLTEDIGLDLTGYYRDIRDWVTTGPPETTAVAGVAYTTYINKDYANVRGLTLSVNKRLSDYYQYNISYTYQVAEGNNSNPSEEFFSQQNGTSPVKQLIPLDWDQTHTLNVTLGLGTGNTGVFFLGRYGSGYPYTPSTIQATYRGQNASNQLPRNSRRKPTTMNLDLRAFHNLSLAGRTVTFSVRVFNLLDTKNELDVFGDTGQADRTLTTSNVSEGPGRVNTVADYIKYPTFYSVPREVQFGIELAF